MSILNVWLGRETAYCAVDTHVVSPDGQASKCVPFVAAGAVLALRGHLITLAIAYGSLAGVTGGFDELVEAFPLCVPESFKRTMLQLDMQYRHLVESAGQELVLCGWSNKLGRMAAVEFFLSPGATEWVLEDVDPVCGYVAPWDPSIASAPNPDSVANIVNLARMQISLLRRAAPGAAAGGRLIVTRLGRGVFHIEDVADLGVKAAVADAELAQ